MMLKALVLAGLVVVPVAISAGQAPTTPAEDGKREFTVSGCLLRSGYAGYQIDDAQVEAIDGKPTGAPSTASAGSSAPDTEEVDSRGGWQLGSPRGRQSAGCGAIGLAATIFSRGG